MHPTGKCLPVKNTASHWRTIWQMGTTSVREYVFYDFFSDFKKT